MTPWRHSSKPGSPPATFLLSVFFGLQGISYLAAVGYAAVRGARDNPGHMSEAIPGLTMGAFAALSFIYGSLLLRHENRAGLKWIVLPLIIFASQWLVDLNLPPGQLLTFFISLIGVTVSWYELTRHDSYYTRIDH